MFFDNFDDFCKEFDIVDVVKLRTFKTAMTHSSVSKKNNYERLEFLGDTLLNFCISKMIYESFPNEQEGCMSRLKSFLVSRKMCRKVAKDIKLDTQVIVAEQQDMSKESGTAKKGNPISRIFNSNILPDFVMRHLFLILEGLACILLYIANRYSYQHDVIVTEQLRRELLDVQYQSLNIASEMSAKSKSSYIEKVVDKEGSGLIISGESPYRLP